jgi:hypothetical protein
MADDEIAPLLNEQVEIPLPRPRPINTRLRNLQSGPSFDNRHSWSPGITTTPPGNSLPIPSSNLLPSTAFDMGDHGMRWRYDDFTTIDWIHDTIREKKRLRKVKKSSWIVKYFDAAQAWIVLFFVGVASGCIAAGMDMIIPILEDLREGYCPSSWISRKSSCSVWISFSGICPFFF